MPRIGTPAENRGLRIGVLILGSSLFLAIPSVFLAFPTLRLRIFFFVVGLAIAIILIFIVERFREYRFRRTHTPEERAALAAQLQVRKDRLQFAVEATFYKRKVLRTGVEARAVITAVDDLGEDDDPIEEVKPTRYLELAVTVGADPPYAVPTGEHLGWGWRTTRNPEIWQRLEAVGLQPGDHRAQHYVTVGRELVVRVDLTDRQRVAVDWKKSAQLRQPPAVRLQELETMRAAGAISDAEYTVKREQIIADT